MLEWTLYFVQVQHFVAEQEWYDKELHRRQATPSFTVTLHNDHALEDPDSPLVTVLDPEGVATQRKRLYTWAMGHPVRWTCGLCNWPQRKSRQDVALHIRSKWVRHRRFHHLHCLVTDFCIQDT